MSSTASARPRPLLAARVPVIERLPDDLPRTPQLLVFQAELTKTLDEEE